MADESFHLSWNKKLGPHMFTTRSDPFQHNFILEQLSVKSIILFLYIDLRMQRSSVPLNINYPFLFPTDAYCIIWTASSEFGTYRLCEQRRFRRACASAQSRQNLRCSLIQAVNQEEPSDRKPDPWPL